MATKYKLIVVLVCFCMFFTMGYNNVVSAADSLFNLYSGLSFLPAGDYSTFGFKFGGEVEVTPGINLQGDSTLYSQNVYITEYYDTKVSLRIHRGSLSYEVISFGNDSSVSINVLGGVGLYRVSAINNTINELGFHMGTFLEKKINTSFRIRGNIKLTQGMGTGLLEDGLIELGGFLSYSF